MTLLKILKIVEINSYNTRKSSFTALFLNNWPYLKKINNKFGYLMNNNQ